MTFLAELVPKGAVADDFSQGAPVVESGDLFAEEVEGGRRPHKQGPKPSRERLRGVFDVVGGGKEKLGDMRGLALRLVWAEPRHPSVIKLLNPFGEDRGPVGARDVKRGSPSHIVLIPLGAFGVLDLVMFDASLQGLNLDA
jgi:hypothetical protein